MAFGRIPTAIVLAITLILAGPLRSENAVGIEIRPALPTAPGSFTVVVQIAPHENNRELVIEADCAHFYRASSIPLDGEQSARTYPVRLKGLPPGHYTITAKLRRAGGDRAAESVVVDVPEGVAAQRQYRCGYAVQGDQVCGIDGERQPGE